MAAHLRSSRAVLALTALAVGSGIASVPVAGRSAPTPQPPCSSPYRALATAIHTAGSQEELPVVAGESLTDARLLPAPDSDGDGAPDTVVATGANAGPASITRGDGTLTFAQEGKTVSSPENAGDLDGDGRDELTVTVRPEGTPLHAPFDRYLLAGTTVPGAHDPSDIGLRVTSNSRPIADQDGDGRADLVHSPSAGPTRFWSGSGLYAIGAPGDARDVEPFLEVPGQLVSFADLGGSAPTVVTIEIGERPAEAGRPPTPAVVHLVGDRQARRFTTAPHGYSRQASGSPGRVELLQSGDEISLVLRFSTRSGGVAYLWRVDAPCGPLDGAAAMPTSAAADAVDARPSYTG